MHFMELAEGGQPAPRELSEEELHQKKLNRMYRVAGQEPPEKPDPEGFWGKTTDILSRGTYMSGAFVDTLLTDGWLAVGKALDRASGELVTPEHRLYFSDVIKKHAPDWSKDNPNKAGVLGFALDVLADPFTWLTFGVGAGPRVAIKGASKVPALASVTRKGFGTLSRAGKKAVKGRMAFYEGQGTLSQAGDARVGELVQNLIRRGFDPEEAYGMADGVVRNAAFRKVNPLNDYSLAMTTPELRKKAFSDVATLIASDPSQGADLLRKTGVRFAGKHLPFSEKIFDNKIWPTIYKYTGLQALGQSKPVSMLNRMFNRYAGLSDEFIDAEKARNNAIDLAEHTIYNTTKKLFKEVDEAGRQRIGAVGHELDDLSFRMRREGYEDWFIREEINRTITSSKLEGSEREVLGKLLADFSKVGDLEKEAGLLQQVRGAYFPRFYELVKDGKVLGASMRNRRILMPDMFTHAERRAFATLEIAQDHGFKPIEDAMLLYTQRMLNSSRALADASFNTRVAAMYPEIGKAVTNEAGKRVANLHGLVAQFTKELSRGDSAKMIRMWGEINQSPITQKEATKMLQTFGKAVGKKRTAKQLAQAQEATYKRVLASKGGTKAEAKAAAAKVTETAPRRGSDAIMKTWLKEIDNTDAAGVVELMAIEKGMPESAYKPLVEALEEGAHAKSPGQMTQRLLLDKKFVKTLPDAPDIRRVADHIRFLGEGKYNAYAGDEINYALSKFDKLQQLFKTGATVARPAFGVRQMGSNPYQAFLKGGIKAVDPRATVDAAMAYGGKINFSFSDIYGLKWTGKQYMDSALKHGIVRHMDMADVGSVPLNGAQGVRRFVKEINRKQAAMNAKNPAQRGFMKLWNGMFNYMYFPSAVEDMSRLSAYGNYLRQGFDEKTAAKLVDEALFDYSHGLSKFETRFMKRMIPFYSFQRFALPLITKATAQTPGRVANAQKSFNGLMTAYNKIYATTVDGEDLGPLTPQERNVLPGWLLDQPNAFAAWDADMKAKFNTFNNFNPLDVMGFLQFDEGTDELNLADTFQRLFLSQITPFVKVPIETFVLKRDSFTGRSLEDARNIREVDPSSFLVQMSTAIATSSLPWSNAGTARYALNKTTNTQLVGQTLSAVQSMFSAEGGTLDAMSEQLLKNLVGWEEGIDPYTGEKAVYVGAYRMHWLGSLFPGLNDAMRLSREDKSVTERASNFLFGHTTVTLDLKQQEINKARKEGRRVQEAQFAISDAYARDQHDTLIDAERDLERLVQEMQMDYAMLERGPIRGPAE